MARASRWTRRRVTRTIGGPQRTRVVVLLGAVLAMSSADTATVGAAASQLRHDLHISNTDIGLLVAVTSLVGAVASIPFGVLADRVNRVRTLAVAVAIWGVAMIYSATASDFHHLLLARLLLGLVTAAAGPIPASLIGDFFPADERGRIYGYLLTGELIGAGIGFAVTGDIAALSWRAAFVVLAVPTFFLARALFRLPEPARGGRAPLMAQAPQRTGPTGQPTAPAAPQAAPGPQAPGGSQQPAGWQPAAGEGHPETIAQRLARERGVAVDEDRVLGPRLRRLGVVGAVRYVLSVRTNVTLILASAFGYFFLSGVETFGVEFSTEQYRVAQALANSLLLLLGVGAALGTLVSGRVSDALLRRGRLNARVLVTAVAALATAGLFVPALLTRGVFSALFFLFLAAFFLSAQNPPIDAARLDIMPSMLWGRAEGIRTTLRTLLQSLAPLLFGVLSDHLFGGGRRGLQLTFLVMLVPLFANGLLLVRALGSYPGDVATAAAAQDAA